MGTVRSPLKGKAVRMRLQGRSYNDIQKALDLPSKGTLSFWLKGLKLTDTARDRLRKNTEIISKRNLHAFNKIRSKRIKAENEEEYLAGKECIRNLSDRELLLVGAALYWGEGTKSDNHGKTQSLVFTNSDPFMVSVYMRFVRKIYAVPDVRIRGGIHVYPNTDVDETRRFWARITKLPPDRLYIITMISRLSAGKRNPHLLPHGTVTIRVHDRRLFHRMKGMIQGLYKAKSSDI